jgi:hypothetical protein
MTYSKRMWHYLVLFFLVILLVLFIPFDLVIAPKREFRVTDSKGNPITDAIVRQIWHQYSLGVRGQIDLRSNLKGEVSLERRVVRTNLIALIGGGIKEYKEVGIHASVGSWESVGIFVNGVQDKWIHDGKGLETGTVVMRKEG